MLRSEKIICEMFNVKGAEYVSKTIALKAVVVLYDKLNQLLLDLYCIDKNNREFDDMDAATWARMEEGKKKLKEIGQAQSIIKILMPVWIRKHIDKKKIEV